MVHSALKSCHVVPLGHPEDPDWTYERMKNWVKNASGKISFSLTDNATHALVTHKDWTKQGLKVKDALKRKSEGQNIHIVSFEWLKASLDSKRKLKERKYEWQHGSTAENPGRSDKGPRSAAGLMSQVFTESTSQFVDQRKLKQIAHERKLEEEFEKENKEKERREIEKSRENSQIKQVAMIFRQGATRARNELLSDTYHIYHDASNFAYDVLLTKVNTRNNKNERYALTLQMFESNAEPALYVVNCNFSGSGKDTQNSMIVALGCPYLTAFHAFKKIFKEKTHIKWEDRVTAAIERDAKEKESRSPGQSFNSHARAQGGSNVAETFEEMPYLYFPPGYGPRGQDLNPTQQANLESQAGILDDDFAEFTQNALEPPFEFGKSENYDILGQQMRFEHQTSEYAADVSQRAMGHAGNMMQQVSSNLDDSVLGKRTASSVGAISEEGDFGEKRAKIDGAGRDHAGGA